MAMTAPKCYRCEGRHYSTQPCPVTPSRPQPIAVNPRPSAEAAKPRGTVTESVTPQHCPTCTCGQKKVHKTNADRQAAYRERRK